MTEPDDSGPVSATEIDEATVNPSPSRHFTGLTKGALFIADSLVVTDMPGTGWAARSDEIESGVFLHATVARPAPLVEIPLGRIDGLKRFTSSARRGPFWVHPVNGTSTAEVKASTLWILAERGDGSFVVLVPLLDRRASFTLRSHEGGLVVVGESGDPAVAISHGAALFAATGDDPFALLAVAAEAVKQSHGQRPRPSAENLPDFMDLFGWCTWDAFYREVTPAKIRAGLAAFAAIGVEPRLLVLDDGWQSIRQTATGEERLISFEANEQFDHDLSAVVTTAKTEFKVQQFFVWHALLGYWGGVCDDALPGYATRTVTRAFGPGVLAETPDANDGQFGALVGVPSAEAVGRFYDDFHRCLRAQGIDGVKVDNQAALEAVSAGQGGRVALAQACRTALESAVARNFDGRMINCMSCTPEGLYLSRSGTMRTSDDFWPLRPETHGAHVYNNAQTALWFGEFMPVDWDMFQSKHSFGSFHAAARAISGGPVYVSDQPGQHDATLLRKLVLSDGTVLRADGPGRVTRDGLFVDPTVAPALLKIFNTSRDCGVVGIFNAHAPVSSLESTNTDDTMAPFSFSGNVSPEDVEGLSGDEFVEYTHRVGTIRRVMRNSSAAITLAPGEWEIVSFAPVKNGFAAIGLSDKLNSTGALVRVDRHTPKACAVTLRDGGAFVAWSSRSPVEVSYDGRTLAYTYDVKSGRIEVAVPTGGVRTVQFSWT
ncbi:Sip1-related alpha-galactosidase [Synoicihabitans lomoniglobus]|uniref:Sip1-related alpha-galactosidase n=1 Tax=Synoicihabitans lomoniglobus TaxID=2909285 RepID=A0AAE9ZWZ8_9BACT|nr:hypothetical protein [Opitutaceae bacterium LMO-M01]WED64734.1 Sip1-related alpha-galactosidase [Opitutaceae bacterium LMO-M01]